MREQSILVSLDSSESNEKKILLWKKRKFDEVIPSKRSRVRKRVEINGKKEKKTEAKDKKNS